MCSSPFFFLGIMSKLGWEDSETFRVFVPAKIIDLSKSGKDDGKRWVQGIASTASRDLQGEIVEQKGIDFSYFLKHGYFNDDHKSGPEFKVGQPTECKVTKNGLWVKGFLFKSHERADYYWELMQALSASQSDRKVGFSIQGKVKRREGNKISECWIQDIALTPSPVNTTTWAEVAKSLSADWMKKEDKGEEKEEKAMAAGYGSNPMVKESLDGKEKESREDIGKSLTLEESVEFLKSQHGLTEEAALAVAEVVFSVC